MNILFSPEYSGHVYVRPATGTVLMDTMVANTMGLVEEIELRLGLHYETTSRQQGLARYYDAMNKYMQSNPDNCLAESFRVSGLKTAQAAMAWRNDLRMAGWDGQGEEISDRMKALAEIEKIYQPMADKDLAERVWIVIEQIKKQNIKCSEFKLYINCDSALFRPLEKSLIDTLQQHGAAVNRLPVATGNNTNLDRVRSMMTGETPAPNELNPNDNSLLIYQFQDRQQANEYLAAANLCGADICIDSDNKTLDHQMRLMGYPQSGSTAHDSAPQLTQILIVGIGLFTPQLNIKNLLQWLDMPLHPLPLFFRNKLSETIARKGGYRNTECQKIINSYINGEYVFLTDKQRTLPEEEQVEIRRKGMSCRSDDVDIFLPPMTPTGSISRDTLKKFTSALRGWCRQKSHLEAAKKDDESLWLEQLSKVIDMAETFLLLLNTADADTLDPKTLDSWISALDKTGDFTGSPDEKDCATTIPHPSQIVTIAGRTLWTRFDGEETSHAECSFLSPSEKDALSYQGHIRLWGENEGRYNDYQQLIPLLHTSGQLILIVCERHEGKPVAKHPLLIRLEQEFNKDGSDNKLETIIRRPSVDKSTLTNVDKICNTRACGVLEFSHADKLCWPKHLSPSSSIGTLVEDPFSFLMEHLLDITPDDRASLQKTSITIGNVAHAVIEALFSPAGGKGPKSAANIANDIKLHYDDVFEKTIEAYGAIFLLRENRLELQLLRLKLHTCILTLCNILNDNNLRVVGCETPIKGKLGFGLPKETDPDTGRVFDTKGYIDMVLEAPDGHPVIFDLKWSNYPRKFRETLEQNNSVQLEFYRRMLNDLHREEAKKNEVTFKSVQKVAYYVMPQRGGWLYSLDAFQGSHVTQLKTDNDINVVEHILGIARENKKTLDSGKADATQLGRFSDYKMFVEEPESNNQ